MARRVRRWIAPLALTGAMSCGAEAPAPATPSEHRPARIDAPEMPPRETPDGGEGPADDSLASDLVSRSLAIVARVRQLDPKRPVRGRSISRADMLHRVRAKLKEDVPPEVVEGHRELLVLLGLVAIDFDYEKSLFDLLGSQLAGFYEPSDKTMYLASDLRGVESRATLSHELVHALQDQYYDLDSKIGYQVDGGDRQAALHSLAEGDAMSAMLDDLLLASGRTALEISDSLLAVQVRSSIALDARTAHVPSILRSSIVAPYVDGTLFVHRLRRQGGWQRVDELWADPPTTTEQLLHPDKLEAREPAIDVPLPRPPPGGPSELVYRDVMGEQSLALTFDEWLPRRPAERAAAGWGGDRVAVYKRGTTYAVAWRLTFDTPDDAREAFTGFEASVAVQRAPRAAGRKEACADDPRRGPKAIVVAGRDVVFVAGPYVSYSQGSRSAGRCADALNWARLVGRQR